MFANACQEDVRQMSGRCGAKLFARLDVAVRARHFGNMIARGNCPSGLPDECRERIGLFLAAWRTERRGQGLSIARPAVDG
ncbi:hypothetical protein ACFP1Z_30725 [Streptomyces gamaensis]|uniref:Uncharacterized protein n=1 Tax=Streptomyces gamaensis TaxID=1763542 RepID=A0ABW0Z9S0_9ACTN